MNLFLFCFIFVLETWLPISRDVNGHEIKENFEEAIKNGQSTQTGNILGTQDEDRLNTICG